MSAKVDNNLCRFVFINLMNKKFLVFIVFYFFLWNLFSQNVYILQGRIIDQTKQTIRDVHVINRTTHFGVTSDKDGMFQIAVSENDKLLVTCMGYKPYPFSAPNSVLLLNQELNIVLLSDTIVLQETLIRPFPATWKEFKKEVVELKITEPTISKEFDAISGPVYSPQGGIVLPGPVSILYSLFSKEAKQARKMEEINHFESLRNTLYSKVSKEMIKKRFKLSTELELENFLFFCNLPEEFIVRAPAYDIVVKLNECYLEYSK